MDRMTKFLLAAIALGLWVNIAVSTFRPATAMAQDYVLNGIASNLSSIANGVCVNHKIC